MLERLDSRYIVATREAFYQSDILLTPYAAEEEIDAAALGAFIDRQYQNANVDPDEIDTGALILTGVAVRRRNARRIGDLFARQAGKMVAVSAGDSLETVMAAHGSGAAARSIRDRATVMNVDVGGGTSKIAICAEGRVIDLTALDVGARLICLDEAGRIVRVEEAGRRFAAELGIRLGTWRRAGARRRARTGGSHGGPAHRSHERRLALIRRRRAAAARSHLRAHADRPSHVFRRRRRIHLRPRASDLRRPGRAAGAGIRARVEAWGPRLAPASEGIRATVIGASQYTTQVSGSTIYVAPLEAPAAARSYPVIAPIFALAAEEIQLHRRRRRDQSMLERLDLDQGETPVAVFVPWRGSATFRRLDRFCKGVVDGRRGARHAGHPLVLAGDGDVGGLIGIHFREEMRLAKYAIVSIDGLELEEFDYIDIGAMLPNSGAVPVVIKSLIFPTSAQPATGNPPRRPSAPPPHRRSRSAWPIAPPHMTQ